MRSLASLSRVHREIRESNSCWCVHRTADVAKRGSEAQGGLPIALIRAFHWSSLSTEIVIHRSPPRQG